MSGILVESRRDLPRLPPPTWQLDDDDDDDPLAPLRADDPIAESTRTVAGGPTAIEATRTAVTTHAVEPTSLPPAPSRPPSRAPRPVVPAPAMPPPPKVPTRATVPAMRKAPSQAPVATPPPGRSRGNAASEARTLPPPLRHADSGALVAGRYKIAERIGQGGMGKVFKVTHAQLGKVFALKLIGEELAATTEARELFYREARLASSLSHQNIASVVDFGDDEHLGLFMVMELVEGEPLAKLLHRERQLSVRLACDIILQCAEALHYIHSNDIVHCDIKTENILITEVQSTKRRQLQVRLLDFGLARSLRTSRMTASLSGTPHYVAPERIRGEPPSPSSDIYGLGILFYELLTGKVPWDGHVAQILAGHLEQPPTPPSQLIADGLDPALEKLVLRALAKTPAQRHKDMAAFIYELRTVMDMLGYGRRARRGGPRRVVIERTKDERAEMIRIAFEGCRLPIALVSPTGLITVANPSFARFVMGVDVEVEGLTVQSTPLASAWDAFETDLARAIGGNGVRRILEVEVAHGEVRRLLMWLDPASNDHAILGVQPIDV